MRPRERASICADASLSARTRPCVHTDIGASVSPPGPSPSSLPPRSPCVDGLMCLRRCPKKIKKLKLFYIFYFFRSCLLVKRGKKCSVFNPQDPQDPQDLQDPPSSPSSAGFVGEAARRKRFFRPSSPSHPSKLYSSLRWLNSKVPKPFFPFIPRLIDVDGF
jgi:hypothetical protein